MFSVYLLDEWVHKNKRYLSIFQGINVPNLWYSSWIWESLDSGAFSKEYWSPFFLISGSRHEASGDEAAREKKYGSNYIRNVNARPTSKQPLVPEDSTSNKGKREGRSCQSRCCSQKSLFESLWLCSYWDFPFHVYLEWAYCTHLVGSRGQVTKMNTKVIQLRFKPLNPTNLGSVPSVGTFWWPWTCQTSSLSLRSLICQLW